MGRNQPIQLRLSIPRQDELIAGLNMLTDVVRSLNEQTARLETTIARATERFAAMRRG